MKSNKVRFYDPGDEAEEVKETSEAPATPGPARKTRVKKICGAGSGWLR